MNEWSSWVIWSQLGIWAGLKLPEIGDRSLRWHSLCSKILTSAPWRIFSGHSINWTRRLIPSWCWGSRSSPGAAPPASAGPDQGTWKTQRVSSYTNSHKFRPQRILPFWAGSNTTDIVQQHVVVSEGNSTFWHPSTSIISHSEMPQLTLHMICSCPFVFGLVLLPDGIHVWKASFRELTLCQVGSQRADWGHENCAAARILGSEQAAPWKVQVRKSAKMHHSIPGARIMDTRTRVVRQSFVVTRTEIN